MKNIKSAWLGLLIWILVLAPIFFVFSFIALFEAKYSNTFYPGIVVAGEPIGGKTYEEVLDYFGKKANLLTKNGIDFNISGKRGTKEITIPMFFNGFTTDKVVEYFSLGDWQDVLSQAYKVGRTGSLWEIAKEQYEVAMHGKDFTFSPLVQREPLESFLNNELNGFLSRALSAQFALNGNKVSILPETVGEKINIAEAADASEKKLAAFDTSPYNFVTEIDTPSISEKDLQPFSDNALALGRFAKLVFRYNGYKWNVDGDKLVSWLTVKQGNKIGADEHKLEDYFDRTINLYIDFPMHNSRFEIKDNKLVEISAGKAGNVVDIKKNVQEIEGAISDILLSQKNATDQSVDNLQSPITVDIPVAVTVEEPNITKDTINKYDIKELVGTATTDFKGASLDRQHNIETGVSKLNGILLAPGEEFSAVNAIGDITEEAGFVEEYVISNGKTQKEIGGGLCQLATTLFRLAIDSGLPIIERVNHRYVVSYYGAGLDATIYGPHPDLRFINDTGNYLLLQGKAENNKVVFEFYGKKDGRSITISEPKVYNWVAPPSTKIIYTFELARGKTKCTEIPHSGVTADVTYTVDYPDGQTKETNFHSVYQPWQKVCLVGL